MRLKAKAESQLDVALKLAKIQTEISRFYGIRLEPAHWHEEDDPREFKLQLPSWSVKWTRNTREGKVRRNFAREMYNLLRDRPDIGPIPLEVAQNYEKPLRLYSTRETNISLEKVFEPAPMIGSSFEDRREYYDGLMRSYWKSISTSAWYARKDDAFEGINPFYVAPERGTSILLGANPEMCASTIGQCADGYASC